MKNPNHPKPGSTIAVEPIRSLAAIRKIRGNLKGKPRDRCLFILGINTAYRANELLSITCGQVAHLKVGDRLDLKQSKTKKRRAITLNRPAVKAIETWLEVHPNPHSKASLFISRTGRALTVPTVSRMVKGWCREANLNGNFGSHTLRKTWGFHQLRMNRGTQQHMLLPILMRAYGHASQEQTMEYLCVQAEEVAKVFLEVEL